MKEKLQILKHANLVDEAILILYQWINADKLEQQREEYRDNYPEGPEWYDQVWDTILEIYNKVKEELKPKKERIEYYFKSKNINFFFNATLAFLWDFQNPDNQLLPYEERVGKLTDEERIKLYAQIINIDEENGAPVEKILTYEDLLNYLDSASCDKAAKWEVLKIFHNQRECYEEVCAILEEVVSILDSRFQEQIRGLEQHYYDYWITTQTQHDIMELMHENLKLIWEANENGTILMPMVFQPISVTLSSSPDMDQLDVLRFGILMDSRFIIAKQKLSAEDIVNFGKLLCDKSKVDILELTARKPCYGKEIATELSLSTATISYHVSALMKLGLLKTEINSNRVYYSMNTEKVAQYLDGIKKYFTNS